MPKTASAASASTWDKRHLLGLEGLPAPDIFGLLDRAQSLLPVAHGEAARLNALADRTIANVFLEDSTRTRCSFTLAARRLGADTIDLTASGSSVSKGETMVDTAMNLLAMGVHGFVVRCSASGGPHMIAAALPDGVPVINAGDGRHEHPTQGLLDLLTLRTHLGELRDKTLAIVGDIVSSRVARSAIHGMTTLGGNVILCGPPTLVPRSFEKIAAGPGIVSVSYDLDEVLPTVDAIMMLRVQFERATGAHDGLSPISADYRQLFGLNAARAARLPDHAIVMHPGPMNRGLEIESDVADDPRRSVILEQVANGVAVRMAVLETVLKHR
jgi:aspartate carbamoyltransferase catalytic subunit